MHPNLSACTRKSPGRQQCPFCQGRAWFGLLIVSRSGAKLEGWAQEKPGRAPIGQTSTSALFTHLGIRLTTEVTMVRPWPQILRDIRHPLKSNDHLPLEVLANLNTHKQEDWEEEDPVISRQPPRKWQAMHLFS